MGKKLKKTVAKVVQITGGDAILDKLGLPSLFGKDSGMLTADLRADKEAKKQKAEQARQEQAARDAQADLSLGQVADVRSADEALLKRRRAGGLSTSLGL